MPKNFVGTRRNAIRSAAYGTTELSTPAPTAYQMAIPVSRPCAIRNPAMGR